MIETKKSVSLQNKIITAIVLIILLLGLISTIFIKSTFHNIMTHELKTGLSEQEIQILIAKVVGKILLANSIFAIIALFLAFGLANFIITNPISEITDLILKISAGNFDTNIKFGPAVECWNINNCSWENCPAYKNIDSKCWYISGTFCRGEIQGAWAKKFGDCKKCDVYQKYCGDEIQKLADAICVMGRYLKEDQEKLIRSAITDELTGLFNHRHFDEKLGAEFNRAKRYLKPLSLIMIDIDYFKCINDAYGHPFGDFILKELAVLLKKSMRTNDIVARYGGEEFAVILPETDSTGAIVVCQEIWEEIESYFFEKEKHKVKIEISLGTASFPEDGIKSKEDLLKYADTALYQAKEKGGNCICCYNDIKTKKETKESGLLIEPESKIDGLKARLHNLQKSMNTTFSQASHALAAAIEVKDMYSYEHINNVIIWAIKIAKEMGLTEREIEIVKLAALLHDIGKIGISDTILLKPGKLDKKEFEIMKTHSQIAIDILKSARLLREEIPLILHHHEWFDGSGYPDGLKGKEIPLGARIIAVSDVYGALISKRSYRDALTQEKALAIIDERSGSQFDPEIVNIFLRVVKKEI